MPSFADHFSPSASAYAAYRPHYPKHLFTWLASVSTDRARVWDCATGSGQAVDGLLGSFDHVFASDPSTAQLAHRERHDRVSYLAMTAEQVGFGDATVGLITVAQALHWLNRDRFYAEARRVLQPGGVLAVWSYGLGSFSDPALDGALQRFYGETVGPFWPAERSIVDAGYRGLAFPFEVLPAPSISMSAEWTLDQFAGYVSTWSAVRRAREATQSDPLAGFVAEVRAIWGRNALRRLDWPLSVMAGRVS